MKTLLLFLLIRLSTSVALAEVRTNLFRSDSTASSAATTVTTLYITEGDPSTGKIATAVDTTGLVSWVTPGEGWVGISTTQQDISLSGDTTFEVTKSYVLLSAGISPSTVSSITCVGCQEGDFLYLLKTQSAGSPSIEIVGSDSPGANEISKQATSNGGCTLLEIGSSASLLRTEGGFWAMLTCDEAGSASPIAHASSHVDGGADTLSGALTGLSVVTASATITGGSLTDGTATITGGAITGATIEGTAVLSGGPVTDGWVLTADGAGAAAWEAAGGGAPEGTAVLSTGVNQGSRITADGDGTSSWRAPDGWFSSPIGGDGSDGAFTATVDVNLDPATYPGKVANFSSFTVNEGVRVTCTGPYGVCIVLVSGDVEINGILDTSGKGGVGGAESTGTFGTNGGTSTFQSIYTTDVSYIDGTIVLGPAGRGGPGGSGAVVTAGTSGTGGGGGGGGTYVSAGGTAGGAVSTDGNGNAGTNSTFTGTQAPLFPVPVTSTRLPFSRLIVGGGGGSGGVGKNNSSNDGTGAAGGDGGGVWIIETAGDFTLSSTGSILATGAAGGNGTGTVATSGSGGGGGGGSVIVHYTGTLVNDGTTDTSGGDGGTSATGSSYTGGAGGAGAQGVAEYTRIVN